MNYKEKKPSAKAIEKINRITEEISEIWDGSENPAHTDVLGSYTGNPTGFEVPEQDADDL